MRGQEASESETIRDASKGSVKVFMKTQVFSQCPEGDSHSFWKARQKTHLWQLWANHMRRRAWLSGPLRLRYLKQRRHRPDSLICASRLAEERLLGRNQLTHIGRPTAVKQTRAKWFCNLFALGTAALHIPTSSRDRSTQARRAERGATA